MTPRPARAGEEPRYGPAPDVSLTGPKWLAKVDPDASAPWRFGEGYVGLKNHGRLLDAVGKAIPTLDTAPQRARTGTTHHRCVHRPRGLPWKPACLAGSGL